MLAISRGLLGNPRLLVMDEPTEGLAPVIVDQVVEMLTRLAEEGDISVLLIEQNLGVATTVASRVAVMVNGRVLREMPAHELANDHELQQRLLGRAHPRGGCRGARRWSSSPRRRRASSSRSAAPPSRRARPLCRPRRPWCRSPARPPSGPRAIPCGRARPTSKPRAPRPSLRP